MATVKSILSALKKAGTEQTRKTFARHGAPDNAFGVKVADLKVIARTIKGEQQLALDLYDTGNPDAQYLAGLVVAGDQMSKKQLESWAKTASWQMISEYVVAWAASESKHGHSLALKWIRSKNSAVASSGWCTYSGLLAIRPDDELDATEIKALLKQVERDLKSTTDRVRYTMNGFVISVGAYCAPLLKQAKSTAKKLGKVEVNMGETACKVPDALPYIEKIESMNRIGKKRKTIRC